jgi:Ca-activated chloride channel family protein
MSELTLGDQIVLHALLSNDRVLAGPGGESFLQINLDAKEVAGGERAAMAMAIVIDRSGSMQGEKIEKVREAAKELVRRLSPKDRIAIISYATDTSVDLPLTPLADFDRTRAERIIDGILDGGGTNLSGGLEAGLEQLSHSPAAGFASRLVLLTDGNANQGLTDPQEIADIAKKARQSGITVSALGVGIDFNEDLMTMVAESGGGSYYYAKDGASTVEALGNEFKSLSKLAGHQVEVALELGDAVTVKEVYGYRTETQGSRLVIPVGDMAGGEERKIMIRLSSNFAVGKATVARVTFGYLPAGGHAARASFEGTMAAEGTLSLTEVEQSKRPAVMMSAELALAAEARQHAVDEFQNGDKVGAVKHLGLQLEKTRARATAMKSPELDKQAQELETAIRNLVNYAADSDEGKDLVKREKHRAREIFAY